MAQALLALSAHRLAMACRWGMGCRWAPLLARLECW